MSNRKILGAVEIGTSKIAVLVGELDEDDMLNIIGHGVCSSSGIRKGAIFQLKDVSDCVQNAIITAEQSAGVSLSEVFLAQTGAHLQGRFLKGGANVSAADRVIRHGDIERAQKDAKSFSLEGGRVYVNHIRNPFLVDGQTVEEPLGRIGSRIEACYWSVDASQRVLSDQMRVINGIDINVRDVILSSSASAAAVTSEVEKDTGCLVIDIGGGTTDFVLYHSGYIVRTGVIPVGGDHLTNDLSMGLRLARRLAEDFKLRHGHAIARKEDRAHRAWAVGDRSVGDRECSLYAARKIIEERLRETFFFIQNELGDFLQSRGIGAGVVLTGGTANLPGIADLAEKCFNAPARTGRPPQGVKSSLAGPEYSTCVGLLTYAIGADEAEGQETEAPRFLRKIRSLFNL